VFLLLLLLLYVLLYSGLLQDSDSLQLLSGILLQNSPSRLL
jgi:hypothetical protein